MRINFRFFVCGMLVIGMAAGCSKDGAPVETIQGEGGVFTLTAEFPEDLDAVKTALGSNYEVVWKTGNTISINGTVSNAVSDGDNGKKCVDFTFPATPSSPYNVLYPGTTSTDVVTFPATQNYVANTFDDNAAPAYGVADVKGDRAVASLTPVNAVLRFALNGTATVTKIELNALGGESISGKFKVNFSTGALTANGSNSSTITYNIGGKTLGGADTYFYVAVPARAYSKGFEALVYEKDTEKYMRLKFFGDGKTLAKGSLVEFVSKTYAAGRVEELAQIGDFTANDAGSLEKKANFTVATYNILSSYDNGRDNDVLQLANAAEHLGKCVVATGADLICFNEIDKTFATDKTYSIQKIAGNQGLTGYTWRVQNPNKVTHEWTSYDKEYTWANGFAFNPSVFEYADEGTWYWFNKNGGYTGTASSAYSSHLSKFRTFVYTKLKHKASGKIFNLLVTHMPNYNDENSDGTLDDGVAHKYAATAINKFMEDKDASGNWILCGDMNAYNGTKGNPGKNNEGYNTLLTKWTDSYEALDAAGNLNDFYKTYIGTQSGSPYYYTWQQYSSNHPERRIDHIMYRGGFKAGSYKTIRLTYHYDTGGAHEDINPDDLYCPSDHLPVVVNFTLN